MIYLIDLHMHTKYSDGTDTLRELLEKAEKSSLEVISITDHNTCLPYLEMEHFDYKEFFSGKIITGCEFTTSFEGRIIEVLGYGFDYEKVSNFLNEFYTANYVLECEKIIQGRILEKLIELDLIFDREKFSLDKFGTFFLKDIYNDLKLYEKNISILGKDLMSSFSNFIRRGLYNSESKIFVDYAEFKPKITDIIDIVHESGGKVFLAHPFIYKFDDTEEFLERIFSTVRLDGVECYHTTFDKKQIDYLLNFSKEHNLLISGGSDYHGENKKMHDLGVGRGNLSIDKSILDNWYE